MNWQTPELQANDELLKALIVGFNMGVIICLAIFVYVWYVRKDKY